jgi:NAD(P)-dependent dehydrogenase (short-subunit alcohol dehydrogenase family)
VRVPEQVRGFVDGVVRLDIAFSNAGIGVAGPPHELTVEQRDDVHATNARGVFLSVKYEIPHLLAAGGGVIICTSSAAAEQVRPPGIPDPDWEAFKAAYGPLNIEGIERMAMPAEIASVLIDGGALAGRKMVMPPGFPPPA